MIPPAKDKPLFTPGPLTTSQSVKTAMLRDLGSRDDAFVAVVRAIREELLRLAGVSQSHGFEAIPLQGSGTFAIEAVISSAISPQGRLLVVINGAYGERIAKIAEVHGIPTTCLRCAENERPDPGAVEAAIRAEPEITMVAVVHCETTSGIMNPISEIGEVVRKSGKRYFVDSMSAFGAVPLDLKEIPTDYLVSSANKCIEGVPGFGFAICRRQALEETEGWARTLSLDLLAQWRGLEKNGQFRFTPPTHAMLAFFQALQELKAEGGVSARHDRYRANHDLLLDGMERLGFQAYVQREWQGPIITSFLYPSEGFDFDAFYRQLNERGFVIYPGKVSDADCFRIGNIGRLFESDIRALLAAVADIREPSVPSAS